MYDEENIKDIMSMASVYTYYHDPYERYRKLKRVSHLSQRQLSAARELAAWREIEASKRNIPRKWVMTDEQIVEACRREARSIDDLFLIRGEDDDEYSVFFFDTDTNTLFVIEYKD